MDHCSITDQYIDQNKTEAFQFLQKLVQQPSVQGNEKSAQDLMIQRLEYSGFKVDSWDLTPEEMATSPYFVSSRTDFENSPNVVGTLKGTGGGKSIIFNGHIDVVPAGDLNKWTRDPFSGHIENGRIYGRGTTDMKGGTLSLLMAIEAIIHSGIRLKGDVLFQSVIEEESGGAGSLDTLLKNYTADAVLIPEPTQMKLFVKQQGSLWFRITIEGTSAHGGTRYEGVSAIEKAWEVHAAILKLEKLRNSKISDPLYANTPIPVPINVGKITGGNWPSSVPDLVVIEGRFGVNPDETIEQAKNDLEICIQQLSIQDDWFEKHPAQLEFFGAQWLPNSLDQAHEFSQTMITAFEKTMGVKPIIEASPWGTDAGLYGNIANIPALVIGPGVTKMAHYPDEYIELDKMVEAAKIFARLLILWCEAEN